MLWLFLSAQDHSGNGLSSEVLREYYFQLLRNRVWGFTLTERQNSGQHVWILYPRMRDTRLVGQQLGLGHAKFAEAGREDVLLDRENRMKGHNQVDLIRRRQRL